MAGKYACWKCGAELLEVLKPFPRAAECPQCHAQLHVCRMCEYYDPKAGQQCREPVAEAVRDKERANFCGYFQIRPNAFVAATDKASQSQQQLDALFGASSTSDSDTSGTARQQLEDLFKK